MPRLELLAAVVASNLDCVVRRELDIELMKSTFWTDSMTAFAYIQSDSRRFKTFVANRVSLIREKNTPDQWCHVVGDDNMADILSLAVMLVNYLQFGSRVLNFCSSIRVRGRFSRLPCWI